MGEDFEGSLSFDQARPCSSAQTNTHLRLDDYGHQHRYYSVICTDGH